MEKLYYSSYNAKTKYELVFNSTYSSDLLYYTNGSYRAFCWVLCGWSVRWSRRSRCEKKEERQELKLGDAQGTPSKYSRRLKRLSLGMPRKASHLSSTSIGMFSDSFHSCDMCNLGASFAFSFHFSFMHHAGMGWSLVDL